MMKAPPFLFFFSFFFLSAQSTLELEVVNALNQYRKANHLLPVKMSNALLKVAGHHTQWMSLVGFSNLNPLMRKETKEELNAHYETIDVPNFRELHGPKERGEFYGVLDNIISYSEICNMTKAVDTKNPIFPQPFSEKKLAHEIILKFSRSSDHNEAMLQVINKNAQLLVGVSVIIKNEIAFTTIFFVEK